MRNDFHPPTLQDGLRPDLAAAIEAMPASRLIGLKVRGFAPGGISVLELPVVPALTFDGRAVQAGVIGMLADYAGVSAASSALPPGWASSTTGFEVHNVAPATGERLVAVGEAAHVGRSQAVSTARVWAMTGDQAVLVAVATTTSRLFDAAGAAARSERAPGR
jgi:acyl-coenzyme A thioesterase PaaI-like protein